MPTDLYESFLYTHQISQNRWLTQELYTSQWFFLVISLLVIYAIWIKLLDKGRLRELLLFGSLTAVSSTLVDLIATSIGFWEYTIRIFPIYPATFPFDFTVLPITFSLVLQYTSTWKGYTIGTVINSAFFSFIICPLFVYLGIKVYHNFNYFYMFLLSITQMIATKAVYSWIVSIERAYSPSSLVSIVKLQPALAKPVPKDADSSEENNIT